MDHQPTLSTQKVLAALVDYHLATPEQLKSALGAAAGSISLNQLELTLVAKGVLSDGRLLELKGAISGLRILDDPSIAVAPIFTEQAVRATGALALALDSPAVAMVEDAQFNVDAVAEMLNTTDFEIWVITANQFDRLYRLHYLADTTAEVTLEATKDIYEVLDEAVRRNASDIHLSVTEPPTLRVDGRLVPLPRQPLDHGWFDVEIPRLVGTDAYALAKEVFDFDSAYTYGASRFRINVGSDKNGMTVALRKIPVDIPTVDELGLPAAVRDFTQLERGLVLVCGPTGSGKSTTLASMLYDIALNSSRHIITLEDPIEFQIPSGRSVVNQRELHASFTSFPQGLRQALRQDPDVILVGELRDPETMETALTAAETGHLVFGTLHTYDSPQTIGRLVSAFSAEKQAQVRAQLAYILKGIVVQTLLPRVTGRGRVAAFEVLVSTPAIQNNLAKVDGHHQLRQTMETGARDGMVTMEIALVDLVRRGLVREEDARFAAPDKSAFERRLKMTAG